MSRLLSILAPLAALVAAPLGAADKPAAPQAHTLAALVKACEGKDGWTEPAPPARIFGNTWYVGTCGISVLLVTGDEGHVLIDGGPKEAAPLVLANIRKLGFNPRDVHWIIASHEHDDHVGALAALVRATGAAVAAVPAQRRALRAGMPEEADPQFAIANKYEPVPVARAMSDGDSVVLGRLAFTAHGTPAHSPGSTSWTWQSCTEQFDCHMIAYADSATTISADDYRFVDHPDRVAAVRKGIRRIGALPCDILLTPHPSASGMMDRFAGTRPLVDPTACERYGQDAQARFEARLAREGAARP